MVEQDLAGQGVEMDFAARDPAHVNPTQEQARLLEELASAFDIDPPDGRAGAGPRAGADEVGAAEQLDLDGGGGDAPALEGLGHGGDGQADVAIRLGSLLGGGDVASGLGQQGMANGGQARARMEHGDGDAGPEEGGDPARVAADEQLARPQEDRSR